MKILKIIHGYPQLYNAGSEVYSQSICSELSERHDVIVLTREENLYEVDHEIRHEKTAGIDFYFVNKARDKDGYKHPDLDEKFATLLRDIKPDIAHIGHLNHLSTGFVGTLKKQNIPIVFTLHDFWLMCPRGQFLQVNFGNKTFYQLCEGQNDRKCAVNCYNRYFSGQKDDIERDVSYWENWVNTRMKETKSIVEIVDIFIAPSRYLLNRFIQDFNVPKDKITYLDYGFPTHYLLPIIDKKNTVFTFGYIGTHIPAKGINQLIEAFSTIKEKAALIIFGRNNGQSTQQLKELALKSANKIEFRGEYINKNLATEVFSQVDCIVVPSIWAENSPLVIHEAQACHIPVITANIGGMAEYVKHLENGLLFMHRSVDDLAEQMIFAIKNPDLMEKLGKRGYFQDEKGLVPTIKYHCEQLETIYQQAIQKNNART
jgi:glycosyltransferase involved in cell wall biosynthesis